MATTNKYNYLEPGEPSIYKADTSGSNDIAMGDMVSWYAAGPYVKPLANGAEALFVGVSLDVAPTPTSNIDNAAGKIDHVLVHAKGVFSFKTTAGETYGHGDAVKCGADAQTVTNGSVAVDDIIGYVWRPNESAALTGAAGVSVDTMIARRFPGTGLI